MRRWKTQDSGRSRLHQQVSLPTEVHLRRLKVRVALDKLERYLNDAAVTGLTRARVIHGKGTGTLKGAVLDYLSSHPLVAKYYPAAPGDGNGGVTIVELK